MADTILETLREIDLLHDEDLRYAFHVSPEGRSSTPDDLRLQAWFVVCGILRGANTPAILGGWGRTTTWRGKVEINTYSAECP